MSTTTFRSLTRSLSRWPCFACLPAFGQTVTGTITGEVTDPSGAVIVWRDRDRRKHGHLGQDHGTDQCRRACTPSASCRSEPTNSPIEATGFTAQHDSSFALEINQTAKINATLKIGAPPRLWFRKRFIPILDTTDSSLGNTISANEIAEHPIEWPELFIPDALSAGSHRHRSPGNDRQQRDRARDL